MSATGQGGLTQISVTLAAAGSAGSKYTFTHNVGRALQTATAVDANGNLITGVTVLQSSLNACVIQNLTSSSQAVLVTLQWEERSTKLNVVSTSDVRMTSGTAAAAPTLYVATTGSDTVGDGSQSKPFATIQRALDVLPATVPTGSVIQLGSGSFVAPTRWPTQVLQLTIYGDRSAPIVDLTSTSWALVAGTTSRWRSNIGAYSASVGLGTHWVEGTTALGFPVGTTTVASTTPNIDSYVGVTTPVALHAFLTTITTPSDTFIGTALNLPRNVVIVGCTLGGSIASGGAVVLDDGGNTGIYGCRVLGSPDFNGAGVTNLVVLDSGGTVPGSMTLGFGAAAGVARQAVQCCATSVSMRAGSANLSGLISGTTAVGNEVSVTSGVLALGYGGSGLDWENNRATVCLAVSAGARVTQALSVKVIGTSRTKFMNLAGQGSSFERTAGTITGAISGVPVTISSGSQAIGIKAAGNGTLTNASVAGDEITVGGNATTTFAAQPTTDVGAAAPQFCRAT